MAAIALVLVPRGLEAASVVVAAVSFAAGGVVFWGFSVWTARAETAASQFAGMALDFFPEALLLGVAAADGSPVVYLLAGLIALQNMPEGFAANHEMEESGVPPARRWTLFLLSPLLGPLSAWLGFACLTAASSLLGFLLLFASGGILYLIFEEIAPRAHLQREAFPALGSIFGFLLGMVGTMVVH